MNKTDRAQEILRHATEAFETATGLRAQTQAGPERAARPGALLDIIVEGRAIRFSAEIEPVDRFQTLGAIKARAGLTPYPLLLVAPYVTEATAEKCRELRLPFMDEAGNAYLEAPGLFILVTGRRRPVQARAALDYRALTPAGLRIVFALLNDPDLAAAPYRKIAKAAGVALGTVGDVLTDLERRGYLAPEKPGPRRLLAPERLQDEWVTHYPIKLRPKLNARRFTAPARDWWRDLDVGQYRACWGGEIAAEKLTGYLKPQRVTLYVDDKPDKLILAKRLRPDVNGEIELLKTFWTTDEGRPHNDIAPPLLVYADLMASTDPRNLETAKLIRDNHLAQVRRTG
jgi:hypothetical protein